MHFMSFYVECEGLLSLWPSRLACDTQIMRKITGLRRVASHTGASGGKPPHSTSFPDDSSIGTEKKSLVEFRSAPIEAYHGPPKINTSDAA
jgi:hypothetical protein